MFANKSGGRRVAFENCKNIDFVFELGPFPRAVRWVLKFSEKGRARDRNKDNSRLVYAGTSVVLLYVNFFIRQDRENAVNSNRDGEWYNASLNSGCCEPWESKGQIDNRLPALHADLDRYRDQYSFLTLRIKCIATLAMR